MLLKFDALSELVLNLISFFDKTFFKKTFFFRSNGKRVDIVVLDKHSCLVTVSIVLLTDKA